MTTKPPSIVRMTKLVLSNNSQKKSISASHLLMLEYLPERHVAMQLQPANLRSRSNPYTLVFILAMQKYVLEDI